MVLVDNDGNRLFDDSQIEELKDYDWGGLTKSLRLVSGISASKDESKKLVGESVATQVEVRL